MKAVFGFLGLLLTFWTAENIAADVHEVVRPLPVSSREILDELTLGSVRVSFAGDGEPFDLEYTLEGSVVLTAKLGVPLGPGILSAKPEACSSPAENSVCATWPDVGISLELYPNDFCTTVEWSGDLLETGDCFDTQPGSHWFGGAEQFRQPWPLETMDRVDSPYVTGDMLQDGVNFYGGIVERYFLNSRSVGVFIHPDVPLFHTVSNGTLCFQGRNALPYKAPGVELPTSNFLFKYDLCSDGPDVRQTHAAIVGKFMGAPESIADERMMMSPIWSSWARYKAAVNETVILQFAEEIISNGYPHAQVEIDDKWETCYGEATFDLKKFPDPAGMIRTLNEKGFRTTVWVHPFLNLACDSYQNASDAGYFVKLSSGAGTSVTAWWNGLGGIVDFTNPDAVEWYTRRMQNLLDETGLDSFKFDAGETNWIPADYSLSEATLMSQPEAYSTRYVDTVSRFGPMVEVRTGRLNQRRGVYFRMLDKLSVWDDSNGLATLIPSLLHANIVGYPYVLPDMIGGNGYSEGFPDKELFIRWLQANVFMPTLQFSYCPWQYDDETNAIARSFVQLHANVASEIISLARQAVNNPGFMVNRPVWWLDPTDEIALTINDEFLLGDSVLIAPVIKQGAVSRDIYLPRGRWVDQVASGNPIHEGPIMLENYPAPLNVLPYFRAAVV